MFKLFFGPRIFLVIVRFAHLIYDLLFLFAPIFIMDKDIMHTYRSLIKLHLAFG